MIERGVHYGVRTLRPEQTLRPKRTLRPIVMHTTIFQINGRNVRFGRKVRFGRNVLRRIVFGRIVLEPYITPELKEPTVLKPSSWFEKNGSEAHNAVRACRRKLGCHIFCKLQSLLKMLITVH